MKAGKLRHRITIEEPTRNRDEYGENIQTWSDVATVWSCIKPLTDRQIELSAAKQTASVATHEVTMRFLKALKPTHRVRFDGTHGEGFENMDDADFEALTDDEFETLETVPPPRYFTINGITDTEERGIEHVLRVTEITV